MTRFRSRAQLLASEVVRINGWRWLPGMRTRAGGVCVAVDVVAQRIEVVQEHARTVSIPTTWYRDADGDAVRHVLPDLDDAGTRGHLLELVRVRWDCDDLCVVHDATTPARPWAVVRQGRELVSHCTSEAAALVQALALHAYH